MSRNRTLCPLLAVAVAMVLLRSTTAQTAITVTGIADHEVYADAAKFTVAKPAGYGVGALLDGVAVAVGTPVEIALPDYHELRVSQTNLTSGQATNLLVRFIVKDSGRGDTEWGLPPWTPYPVINSSPEELRGAHLDWMVPASYPADLELPAMAWLRNEAGAVVRANVRLTAPEQPELQIRRGAGAGFFASTPENAQTIHETTFAGQPVSHVIARETNATWTQVAGVIGADTTWPAGARVSVYSNLTIAAGAQLRIGSAAVIRVMPYVDLFVNGTVLIEGTTNAPVVITAIRRDQPWGGFILRGAAARLEATGTIFTGSGANSAWFSQNSGYDVHRKEQALFLIDGATVRLTDSCAFDHAGQFGHGKNGYLNLTRSLVQRFITGGEYNGGSVQINQSALMEFPRDNDVFADGDNDGIYFTTGSHAIRDSVIGWTKDDGIDHGSGGTGSTLASNVWVEACYHEGFAWSGGGRSVTNLHCVALNCGQGIEAGWSSTTSSPLVFADHCLSTANLSGARFGDNYDWTYNGFLRVTNSLLLYNYRDIYGLNWDDWTYRHDQMDLQGNHLTSADTNHPNNAVWSPDRDAGELLPFLSTPADARVGIGLALWSAQLDLRRLPARLPIRLSTFTTNPVSAHYTWETSAGSVADGEVNFAPGETVRFLPVPAPPGNTALMRLRLSSPANAELTGLREAWAVAPDSVSATRTLVPAGAIWRYLDDGSDQGTHWVQTGFDDNRWKSGAAELGYGDTKDGRPEQTVLSYGSDSSKKHVTYYFRRTFEVNDPMELRELTARLKRDDGAVVYLNGMEIWRSNMPSGPVTYQTLADNAGDDGAQFFTAPVDRDVLRTGTNVVAVEVHQDQTDSSDISFDFQLDGTTAPVVRIVPFAQEWLLTWDNPAFVLEQSSNVVGPWEVHAKTSPVSVEITDRQRFYRLRENTSQP